MEGQNNCLLLVCFRQVSESFQRTVKANRENNSKTTIQMIWKINKKTRTWFDKECQEKLQDRKLIRRKERGYEK